MIDIVLAHETENIRTAMSIQPRCVEVNEKIDKAIISIPNVSNTKFFILILHFEKVNIFMIFDFWQLLTSASNTKDKSKNRKQY